MLTIFKWMLVLIGLTSGLSGHAALFDINSNAYISCTTDDSTALVKVGDYEGDNSGDKLRAAFYKWTFDKIAVEPKKQFDFIWRPNHKTGSKIEIITKDETYHTLVSLRSKTNNSIIVASSASRSYTTESWLFTFNFNIETMLATRVQSGVANVRGEVMTFYCNFEALKEEQGEGAIGIN